LKAPTQPGTLINVIVTIERGFAQKYSEWRKIMKKQLKRFLADESGQDVAEYALLLVLVGIAIAIASPTITASILSVFSRTKSVLGV
jgi:Flp pilus assembly pilin Flp